MTTSGHYVITAKAISHLIIAIAMEFAKSKNIPQILFEKDLPQLTLPVKAGVRFDQAAVITMFLAAAILTFASWVVLERMFGEDFMDG